MNVESSTDSNPRFGFSRWEVFEPLRRHGYFIFLFTLSAALGALAMTYIYDEKYEAQATIMLKPTEVTRLKQHSSDNLALGVDLPKEIEYKVIEQTLTDLAESEPLLRRVVTKLHLDTPESHDYSADPFYQRWYEEFRDWAEEYGADIWSFLEYGRVIEKNPTDKEIEKLHKDVTINSEDSYVFILKVRDKGVNRVAKIADEVAAELISTQRANARGHAQSQSGELSERLALKYAEIQADEQKIHDLLSSNHVASIQEELVNDENQYSSLKTTWLNLQAQISLTQATIASYDEKLRRGMGDAAGEQRLQAGDYKTMESEKLASEVALDGYTQQSASLEHSMAKLQARMQEFPKLQVEYDLLDNNRTRAQHDYMQINDALQEAVLQEQSNVTALILAGRASSAGLPVTPIKIYHVGLAAALGLLVAVGLAFVFGYFDFRFFMSSEGPGEPKPERSVPARAIVGAHPVAD
jgi:uncharacterized protein involved in exopolysaccharide biosynthesis